MGGFGFEKLIEKLLEYWDKFIPWEVINHYDRGVRLRWGKPVRYKPIVIVDPVTKESTIEEGKVKILNPGFHWKLSFIDEIASHMVKITTLVLKPQLLTTSDGKSTIVKAIVKYDVKDVAALLLEVDEPITVIADTTQGAIKKVFNTKDWETIQTEGDKIDKEITMLIRKELIEFGIRVKSVTITNLMLITPTTMINIT